MNTTTIWKIPTGEFTHTEMAELNGVKNQAVWAEYKRLRDEGFIVSAGIRKGKGKPTGIWKVADGAVITVDPTMIPPKPVRVEKPIVEHHVVPVSIESVAVQPVKAPKVKKEKEPKPEKNEVVNKVETVHALTTEVKPKTNSIITEGTEEIDFRCPVCKTKMFSQPQGEGITVWCPVNDLSICKSAENPYGHSNNIKNAYAIACEKFRHI